MQATPSPTSGKPCGATHRMLARTKTGRFTETSSGGCLPDLPLSRLDPPQVRPVFSSKKAIGQAIARLSGVRVRVTLCRLRLPAGLSKVNRIAEAIADPSFIVETASDGSILVLAVGPRRSGRDGDAETAAMISDRLLALLAKRHDYQFLASAHLSMLHCWSDCLDTGAVLFEELSCQPSTPLVAPLRAA